MRKGTVCSWIWHGVGRDSTNFSDGQGMPGGPVTIAPHSWLTGHFGLYWFFGWSAVFVCKSEQIEQGTWVSVPFTYNPSLSTPLWCYCVSKKHMDSLALQGNSWSGTKQRVKCGFPNLAEGTPTHFHHLLWYLCPCDQGHLPVTVPFHSRLSRCLAHVHSKKPKKEAVLEQANLIWGLKGALTTLWQFG